MREKTAKKRSIQYLLSADHRLHKLSLKKIADPAKKSKQARSHRSKSAARVARASVPWIFDRRAIVAGACAVVVGVVLVAASQPSTRTEVTSVEGDPAVRTPAKATAAVRPIKATTLDSTAALAAKSNAPAAAAPTPTETAQNVASVTTVTGCLELDDETFRLKDASGADAPAGRSWKSGFFKKRRPSVEIVDGTKTLRLRNYVGQRVAATGTLAQGELDARSVRRIAASCN